MLRRLSILSVPVIVAVLVMVLMSGAITAQDAVLGPVTQAVVDRDALICGVNPGLGGFAVVDESGEYTGFDVDFCRAVAAAILGDATKVQFRPLVAADRQAAIQGGEIDLMIRNTTWTLSRDTTWGSDFGPTTFYDGQGIGVRSADGYASMEDLDGGSICVQSGTTTELNITDAVTTRGLSIDIQTFPDAAATWEAFVSARCDGWTTDKSGILAYHASSDDPSAYVILPETLSKEPLGPLWPQSDPQFGDIVKWTIYGMIQAEEWDITSANIGEFTSSDDPGVQRLLGIGDNPSGSYLGVANDFMVAVISQVGNYGEVFERNLGVAPFNLNRDLNDLWTRGGLLYSPPFR